MTARLIALVLLLAPGMASAQTGSALMHERIAQISDTAQLLALEQQYGESAGGEAAVAAGLTALRLWEVTGEREHARRSRRYFDRAADRAPHLAWAHYGHALSLQAEMDREPSLIVTHINSSRALGLDPVSRARRALERAVALDPTLPGAVELLAKLSTQTRDEEGLLQARTTFERAAAGSRSSTTALLGVARTARELGDYGAAADAARRAVAVGSRSAAAQLELALSLASTPDSLAGAGRAYGAAVRLADADLLERMWDDAALLRTEREAAAWDSAGTEQRRSLLHTFWSMRGALAAITGEERAAEHYRRVTHARRSYPRHGAFGATPMNMLRLEKVSADYDDRGVIYIRHGAPDVTAGAPPLHDYTAWFYTDEQGERISYHFFNPGVAGHSRDYLLLRRLPCPLSPEVVMHDHRLAPLLYRCDPLNVRSVSAEIVGDSERALRTDSHRPPFIAALPFHYDMYTFRGHAGTELLVGVGVALDRMPAGARSLRVGFALVDTMAATVAQASSITERVELSTVRGSVMRTHLSMVVSPSAASVYRVDVRDAANARIGTVFGGDIELPDYSGDTLMVSDVVLAEQREGGGVVRGEQRLALAPTQVFPAGSFRAYYEIYNMPAGAAYRTEIRVQPLHGGGLLDSVRRLFGGDDGVELRFDDSAPLDAAGTLRQVRDITAPFETGVYLLTLTITNGPSSITRERRFSIEQER